MRQRRTHPAAIAGIALLGGAVAALLTWQGSLVVGLGAGLAVWAIGVVASWLVVRRDAGSDRMDPGRRRLLVATGVGGLAWVAGGAALARAARSLGRADPLAAQEAAAAALGGDYMELVRRSFRAGRSGDLQLVLAPFNSSNYPNESLSLVPRDPRTSHASVWMYLQRIPLLVHAPGLVPPSDHETTVTLADVAPTIARLVGATWPEGRDGRPLPGVPEPDRPPRVVVTVVIDGGGWNVLERYPDDWPTLRALMRASANHRGAIVGSFPTVTASAHATIGTGAFPWKHGITGHNIRDGAGPRKAYRTAGRADPTDLLLPTLADLWYAQTGGRAWVGEVGYQVWHLGMLGVGGRGRAGDDLPVGVYYDEYAARWAPHHPDRYRLPREVPAPERLAAYRAAFEPLTVDRRFDPKGRQADCCSPPIVRYQGDLLEAVLEAEPIGSEAPGLLFTTFKAPDYAGHLYGMQSAWTALALRAVDEQLARLWRRLDERFGAGGYALIVTADHGQCPLPDDVGGVRLDPIQLEAVIERSFGGLFDPVQAVVPHEVYLDPSVLWDAGADVDEVAASLRDLTYRQTLGSYVPPEAVEEELLDRRQFAAVFSAGWLERLLERDPSAFGATAFVEPGVDIGTPPPP